MIVGKMVAIVFARRAFSNDCMIAMNLFYSQHFSCFCALPFIERSADNQISLSSFAYLYSELGERAGRVESNDCICI